jgi:hypothetical protein
MATVQQDQLYLAYQQNADTLLAQLPQTNAYPLIDLNLPGNTRIKSRYNGSTNINGTDTNMTLQPVTLGQLSSGGGRTDILIRAGIIAGNVNQAKIRVTVRNNDAQPVEIVGNPSYWIRVR